MKSKKIQEIDIINYSDTHGRYLSKLGVDQETQSNGLDRLSTYISKLRAQDKSLIVIENGDSIQGTPLVDLHNYQFPKSKELDHPITIVHEALGVDCFVPGNHEFNFGISHIENIRKESKVPWICSNIKYSKTGRTLFLPHKVFCFEGFRIGVLGLTTDYIPKWENSSNIRGLDFVSVIDNLEDNIRDLKQQCDYLIVVYHGGLERIPGTSNHADKEMRSENQGFEIWSRFDEIDLLLLGHQHRLYSYRPRKRKKAIIVQPSSFGKTWSHIKITIEDQKFKTSFRMIKAEKYAPDKKLIQLLKPHLNINKQTLNSFLGRVTKDFSIKDPMKDVWTKKHPYIQWIQNLMIKTTNVDIAAISLLDSSLTGLPENVTMREILRNYFFHNTICILRIDGRILRQALELAASFFQIGSNKKNNSLLLYSQNIKWKEIKIKSYNYDMWSGIEYTMDIRRKIGSRITKLRFKGKTVKDNEQLDVAVTTYRAGGAFYTMFSPDMIIQEFPVRITDLMIQDLLEQGDLDVKVDDNFNIRYK
ncbi:MAG: bifunctional metallophosphatase/5'-nucleotidase [Proteobacteria bacterium]|nr:bifunctional metallophosphatase/5'-nucleotidase [Pseudomonadota bacterium]